MDYFKENLGNIVRALRAADAQKAVINYDFRQPSAERASIIWAHQSQLLATDPDEAIDTVTMVIKAPKQKLDLIAPGLTEVAYSFRRALFVLYKQLRGRIAKEGLSPDNTTNGGQLHVESSGVAFWEHHGEDGKTVLRIELSRFFASSAVTQQQVST